MDNGNQTFDFTGAVCFIRNLLDLFSTEYYKLKSSMKDKDDLYLLNESKIHIHRKIIEIVYEAMLLNEAAKPYLNRKLSKTESVVAFLVDSGGEMDIISHELFMLNIQNLKNTYSHAKRKMQKDEGDE